MHRTPLLVLAAVLLATLTWGYRSSAVAAGAVPRQIEVIPPACIPFTPPIIDRPIDNGAGVACGLPGNEDEISEESKHHGLQNRIKNNFCVWQDTDPALVTMKSFEQLTAQMPTIPGGGRGQPLPSATERASLRAFYTTSEGDTIGEGSYVQYVGFLLEGHFGGSESVNCGATKRQSVDIHLALVTAKPSTLNLADHKTTECTSVSAELSPHHRPIDWDILGRMTKSPAAQKLIGAQARLKDEDLARPLRIRGQLFFDASHTVCAKGQPLPGHPARRSNWEIHPVYSIDVCAFTTIPSCPIDNEDRWTPLTEFLTADPDEGGGVRPIPSAVSGPTKSRGGG